MNRRSMICLAIAGLLVTAAAVQAQPPRQGGPGGFGAMGAGMGLAQLVRMEAVRTEIGLTQEQAEKVREVAASVGGGRGQGARQNLQDMTDAERRQWREDMEARTAEMEKKLGEVLSADQMKRLRQIQVQAMGTRALMSPNVVKELSITEEQQEKMRTASREAMQGTRGGGAGQRPDREAMAAAMEKANAAMLDVLTADQKAKFEELKGKPFDVAQLRGEGAGRPRGGRGN